MSPKHRTIEVAMHHNGQLVMKSTFTDMGHYPDGDDIREVLMDMIRDAKTLEVGDTFSITEVE